MPDLGSLQRPLLAERGRWASIAGCQAGKFMDRHERPDPTRSGRSTLLYKGRQQLANNVLLKQIEELFKFMKMGRGTPVGTKHIKFACLPIVSFDVRANITFGHEMELA
jgi:hypothetical protein